MKNIIVFIIAINAVIASNSIKDRALYTNDMAELIFEYYHKYKYIKRLSLFFCNDQITHQRDSVDMSELNTKHEWHTITFQQTVKRLMASAKLAIKGVQNIDEIIYNAGTGGNYSKIASLKLIDMLECGDFKQGVVLDLRCRQSDYILQQVNYHMQFVDAQVGAVRAIYEEQSKYSQKGNYYIVQQSLTSKHLLRNHTKLIDNK